MGRTRYRAQLVLGAFVVLCVRLTLSGCSSGGSTGYDMGAKAHLTWEARPSGTSAGLIGVWGDGVGGVIVLAADGSTLRSGDDGATWTAAAPRAGLGVPDRRVSEPFAVDREGYLTRYNGAAWEPLAFDGVELEGVWAAGPDEAFVVGSRGAIFGFDGRSWRPEESPTAATLKAVWGDGAGRVWAVGDGGTILRGR